MMYSEASRRYAQALYHLSKEKGQAEKILVELRALESAYLSEESIREYLVSPIVPPAHKIQTIEKTLGSTLQTDLVNTLKLLAEKNRLSLFAEIAKAFEAISDEDHGVTRGTVRSAAPVTPQEKEKIEKTVNQVTGKKVILKYEEDKSLLGGMTTQVGGWTFDDSLNSHLHKLTEELNRRG